MVLCHLTVKDCVSNVMDSLLHALHVGSLGFLLARNTVVFQLPANVLRLHCAAALKLHPLILSLILYHYLGPSITWRLCHAFHKTLFD